MKSSNTQKTSFAGVIQNRCSKFRKFHRKIVLESLVNKAAGLQARIKMRPQHKCFPMKFVKLSRKPILRNNCERLPLVVSPIHFYSIYSYAFSASAF